MQLIEICPETAERLRAELPTGAVIWLDLSKNSMMDGSPLAVARVMLTFKP